MTKKGTTYWVIWPGHLIIVGSMLMAIGIMIGITIGVLL